MLPFSNFQRPTFFPTRCNANLYHLILKVEENMKTDVKLIWLIKLSRILSKPLKIVISVNYNLKIHVFVKHYASGRNKVQKLFLAQR